MSKKLFWGWVWFIACFLMNGAMCKNRGINNIGNTCYFNGALQALSHIKSLNDLLFAYEQKFAPNSITRKYIGVIRELQETRTGAVNPRAFRDQAVQLKWIISGRQEDSQEFLENLWGNFVNDIQFAGDKITFKRDWVTIFDGLYKSTVMCNDKREHVFTTWDSFTGWPLDIHGVTLNDSLRYFSTEVDRLEWPSPKTDSNYDDRYFCPKCGHKVDAEKQMIVARYPNVLAIHLKRFIFDHYDSKKKIAVYRKNDGPVQIPELLVIGSLSYNLRSFVVHGGSISGGHYTAYAKEIGSEQWFFYNDDSPPQEKLLLAVLAAAKNAYVFFYELDDTSMGAKKLGDLRVALDLLHYKLGELKDKLVGLKK